jgi:hypothetical protein
MPTIQSVTVNRTSLTWSFTATDSASGLAAGDPALAKLENRLAAKPKIVVPAGTLDGVDDPPKSGGRHVAPLPSDLATGDDGSRHRVISSTSLIPTPRRLARSVAFRSAMADFVAMPRIRSRWEGR